MTQHSHPEPEAGEDRGPESAIHEMVFGASDGLVSIVGLVTGVAVGAADSGIVLLAGIAGAVSGAISMAAGNYLGVRTQTEMYLRRLREERRNLRERPDEEREELKQIYRRQGLTEEQIEVVVPAVERNRDFLMQEMAAHELGITHVQLQNPLWKAVWIFVAYILAAVFPVSPYALFPVDTAMPVSIVGTLLALFAVGAGRTRFTGRNWLKSGIELLIIAAMAGVAGYLAGRLIAPQAATIM